MIELGDTVVDVVTKFKGVAVSSTRFLQGCDRITVQPLVEEGGKLPEAHSFDEPQLEVIESVESKSYPEPQRITGGPDKYPDKPKAIIERRS